MEKKHIYMAAAAVALIALGFGAYYLYQNRGVKMQLPVPEEKKEIATTEVK